MKRTILIADDHQIIRDGLRSLIEKRNHLQIIGEAQDGQQAVRMALEQKPDLVIMDISMPGLNGIEAAGRILASEPGIRIIALSMHTDRRYVTEMIKTGASGYLLKDCAFDELLLAIEAVLNGQVYLSPRITGTLIGGLLQQSAEQANPNASSLSSREREVLQLIAEGLSTKEIAARLFLSAKTIETHRQHIMDKLNIHSLAELIKFAIREGYTSL